MSGYIVDLFLLLMSAANLALIGCIVIGEALAEMQR